MARRAQAPRVAQATPPGPPGESGTAATPPERFIILNFDQVDIEVVIRAASEIAGFSYVVEPEVKGKRITVATPGRIRHQDVVRTLLAVLEVHGVTAVASQNLYKFVRLPGTPARPVPTIVGSVPAVGRADDEIVTQIVPLERASVVEVQALLRPLMSAAGSLLAHGERNVLVLTDTVANIRRLLGIVNFLEAQVSAGDVHVIPVRFADAHELATVLSRLAARADDPPFIVAHRGSNALIVRGTVAQVELIRRQVAALDTEISRARRVFFYFAEHAKAADLAAVMNAVGADEAAARFVGDERANAVIVTTSSQRWPDIEHALKGLDREPRQVVIEALAVEVTQTAERTLDVAWAGKAGSVRVVQAPSTDVLALAALLTQTATSVSLSPLTGLTALVLDTDRLLAFLHAVATETQINVLSNTRIAVAEGKKALINASQSIPTVTAAPAATAAPGLTSGVLTQNIEYRDVGIILAVTPRVGDKGTVILEFKHTLQDIGERDQTLGLLSFTKREAENSVVVPNQQTLVIGGLLQKSRGVERSGVPFLSKIPVLGALFGHQSETDQKREILILVTPRVLEPRAAAGPPPAERESSAP